ncbi:MAG: hypothetical protein A3K19_27245 [Lentisphaerae bacterium RIFOXYB12_FULL_65_16]|nr:MAG: hypothetical protein A3K19_27245 [Lentisphaerae bacterium RIFOXYB12_FULL_65_16]
MVRILALLVFPVLAIAFVSSCKTSSQDPGKQVQAPAPTRPSWAPAKRPLVFCRSQTKYNHYMNYVYNRTWIDRPLLFDRATGPGPTDPKPGYGGTLASFAQDIRISQTYGIDGLGMLLGYKRMAENGFETIDFVNRAAPQDFALLYEFSGDRSPVEEMVAYQAESIRRMLACKNSARLDGKILICSYVADSIPAEKWNTVLGRLRETVGDTFIFIADIACPWVEAYDKYCENGRSVPAAEARTIEDKLRAYLEATDGIMFALPTVVGDSTHYDRRAPKDFYDLFVIPLICKLRDDPAYSRKYFGAKVALAYVNHMSGVTKSDDGTKTLRYGFETAMRIRPDVINLPEWNEVNENTCFEPTVAKSFSTQRILKYYMHVLKDEAPAPNPGDDIAIPNLIVSYRPYLKLGEPLEIEVLNVPDSAAANSCDVRLWLRDMNGRVVKEFPPTSLSTTDLKDVTLRLPTEDVPDAELLRPVLEVRLGGGSALTFEEGLQPIHVRATWNWNYLWTKQPLRDLCHPGKSLFKAAGGDGLTLPVKGGRLQGVLACAENLAALEVLEEGEEMYGVGREKEYPSLDTHTLFLVTYQGKSGKPFTGKLSVNDASFELLPSPERGYAFHTRKDNAVFVNFKASIMGPPAGFFLAIPSKEISQGALVLDFNAIKGTIALRTACEFGMAALTGEDGVSVVVRPWTWLPDIPPRINSPEASFDIPFTPHVEDATYHMRAVTTSGKTYRSQPLVCRGTRSGEKTKLSVYSETRCKPVDVRVDKERIPDLAWEFNPLGGGVLPSRNAPRWNGQLGSAVLYGETFHSRSYPPETRQTAPTWETEDGAPCLKFDGVGTFVHFPAEAFPRGSFTIHFEFKPLSDGNQVLFTHHGSLIGSLTLRMDKGRLTATFVDTEVNEHRLDPEVSVPIGEWSVVDVMYNFHTFRIRVNGKEGKPVPLMARALYLGPCVFGGYPVYGEFYKGAPTFFRGYLRAFRISHRAD